jgi:hypothetical protein
MASKKAQATKKWEDFVSDCLKNSVDFGPFRDAVLRLYSEDPLGGQAIFTAWAKQHKHVDATIRTRLLCYFEQLIQSRKVNDAEVLTSVAEMLKTSLVNQDMYVATWTYTTHTGVQRIEKGWKETVEAAALTRLTFQMINHRDLAVDLGDRRPDLQICRPLIACLSIFNDSLAGVNPLIGPGLEIGNALGNYLVAFIHDLSVVGLLTCENGGPPKSMIFSKRLSSINPTNNSQICGRGLGIISRRS